MKKHLVSAMLREPTMRSDWFAGLRKSPSVQVSDVQCNTGVLTGGTPTQKVDCNSVWDGMGTETSEPIQINPCKSMTYGTYGTYGVKNNKVQANYVKAVTTDALMMLVEKIRSVGLCAFDVETTGLDFITDEIVGCSFSVESGKACYVPMAHTTGETQLGRRQALALLERFPYEVNQIGYRGLPRACKSDSGSSEGNEGETRWRTRRTCGYGQSQS
jgi:hypothetical protein